jgi:uncharacterized protein YqgQ
VRWLNGKLLARSLKSACRTLGFENPLVWIFMPHYAPVLRSLPNKGIIYYVTDEYTASPGVEREVVRKYEEEILSRADVVFTVSVLLKEKKAKLNAHTYLSRHGVDLEFFARAFSGTTKVPDDIAGISRPIAGFFGLIEEWVDLGLIAYLAEKLPSFSFVLIGRLAQDASQVESMTNVHLLGPKPYATLPGYLKAFDVGLLPYKKHRQVEFSNPKKFREYLAGGKPVVSVRNQEVETYGNLVYVGGDYAEFAGLVKLAVDEDSEDRRRSRIAAMSVESWEEKVEQISRIIVERIPDAAGAP